LHQNARLGCGLSAGEEDDFEEDRALEGGGTRHPRNPNSTVHGDMVHESVRREYGEGGRQRRRGDEATRRRADKTIADDTWRSGSGMEMAIARSITVSGNLAVA
jgi:hypothetical protein